MERLRKSVYSKPAKLFYFMWLVVFDFVGIYTDKERYSHPMSFFSILFSENIMRRQLLVNHSLATVFFQHFPQNIFLQRNPEIQFPRTGIPPSVFVAALCRPLMHQEVTLAVMTIKRGGDAYEIKTDFHIFYVLV